ncbi:MAG TPA: SOS response-associated peptidase [Thiobacillaceae bacterium]|nr:SOS response-associated peptidase [Thiobacillaceae bacterium]
MCGRYALTSPPEVIAQRFNLLWVPELSAHYNIAPSQMIPAVRDRGQGRELVLLKWGLIPSWAKDSAIGVKLINARAETLADKPAFRSAYLRRRCLIPADAFYEWKHVAGRKQPYCIRMTDHAPFAMAGLWEHWVDPHGQAVETCTIITTNANTLVAELHDRMPVILAPGDYARWLARNARAQELLKPFSPEQLTSYPVAARVNNVKNDDAECIAPLAA